MDTNAYFIYKCTLWAIFFNTNICVLVLDLACLITFCRFCVSFHSTKKYYTFPKHQNKTNLLAVAVSSELRDRRANVPLAHVYLIINALQFSTRIS